MREWGRRFLWLVCVAGVCSPFLPYTVGIGVFVAMCLVGVAIWRGEGFPLGRAELAVVGFAMGWWLWGVVSLLWSEDLGRGVHLLYMRVPLVLSVLAVVACVRLLSWRSAVWVLTVLGLVLSAVCWVHAYVKVVGQGFSFWGVVTGHRWIISGRHFSETVGIHPSYLSFLLFMGFVVFMERMVRGSGGLWGVVFWGVLLFFVIFTWIFLDARISVLFFVVGVGGVFLRRLMNMGWWQRVVIFLVFVAGIVLLVYHTRHRWGKVAQLTDERLMVWRCALQTWQKEGWLTGAGTGDALLALERAYEVAGLASALEQKLNVHNQFLEAGVEGGLVGVLLLVGLMLWLVWYSRGWWMREVSAGVAVFMCVESLLNVQRGVLLMAVVVVLAVLARRGCS